MGEVILKLKRELREETSPFFTDEDLQYYYNKNNEDFNLTCYECFYLRQKMIVLVYQVGLI